MMPKSALIFYYFCNNMKMHLSDELITVFSYAKEEAIRTGSYEIDTAHFLLGLLRHKSNDSCTVLRESGIDLPDLKSYLDSVLRKKEAIPYMEDIHLSLSREAENCYNMTLLEATLDGSEEVVSLHLLLAISKSICPVCEEYFSLKNITYNKLASYIKEHGLLPSPSAESSGQKNTRTKADLTDRLLGVIEIIKKENTIFS